MGIRLDASGDYLNRASAFTTSSFTAMGWCQVASDLGPSEMPIFVGMASVGSDADVYLIWRQGGSGSLPMTVVCFDAVGGDQLTTFGSKPAVGEWFHWYIKCSGTGANLLEAGWRRL